MEQLNQVMSTRRHLDYLQFKSCSKHNRPFEYLNLKCPTHNEMLCSDCVIGDLNLVRLGDPSAPLVHEKLNHIREMGSKSRQYLSELREEEVRVSTRLRDLEQSKEHSLGEIRRVFGSLHEALDIRQRVLEQEVEEMNKSLTFSFSDARERSRVWQGQLRILGECVEELEACVQSQSNSSPQLDSLSAPTSTSSSSSSSLSTSTAPSFSPDKGLMIDVCLLEDALRNALSSQQSQKTSSENMKQVQEKETGSTDGEINFHFSFQSALPTGTSKPPSPSPSLSPSLSPSPSPSPSTSLLSLFLDSISTMGSVSSSSSAPSLNFPLYSPVPPVPSVVDWTSRPKHVKTLQLQRQVNSYSRPFPGSLPVSLAYFPISKRFYFTDCGIGRIEVFRLNPLAESKGELNLELLSSFGVRKNEPFTSSTEPLSIPKPMGISFHEGRIYVVDFDEHQIIECREQDGIVVQRLGKQGAANGQFSSPTSCTISGNNLFVSDQGNHRIQVFSLAYKSYVRSVGSWGSGVGKLTDPMGLAVFNGKLYVADLSNDCLSVFDAHTGRGLYVIGPLLSNGEKLLGPNNLLAYNNLLFISSNHCISVLDVNDQCLYSFGSQGSRADQFSSPSGMCMVDDRLFVCDRGNNRIQVFCLDN